MTRLRTVKPGEKPPEASALTVEEAAASGDRRALLVAMRDRIARAVTKESCPPRDLASLTRRLQEIEREIASLDLEGGPTSGEPVEDGVFDPASV